MSNRGPSTGTLSTAPGPVIPPEQAASHAEASVTREAGDVPLTPVGLRLLTALYTTQFIGVGFLTVGLVAILREQGASLSTLGLIQLLGIIWPLKIFWAPLIDRYSPSPRNGHYRSWLMVLQTGMVISLLGLLFVTDPIHQLPMLVAVVALFVVMSATQDIAADAISVRGLAGRSRDMGSAVQVSASYLGTLIGGAGAVLVADHWGVRAAGVFLAAATGVALIPVLRFREHPGRVMPLSDGSFRRDYFGVFSDPECRRWCLLAMPLMYIGFAGVYSLVTPALTDVGFSLSEISLITLVVGAVPAIVAGMAAGYLDSRVSRRASVIGGMVLMLASVVVLLRVFTAAGGGALPGAAGSILGGVRDAGWAHQGGSLVWACVGVGLLLAGYTMVNVSVYTQALAFARAHRPGSDFTLVICISLGVSFLAGSLTLSMAQAVGYSLTAVAMMVIAAVGAAVALGQLGARSQEARTGLGPAPRDRVGTH